MTQLDVCCVFERLIIRSRSCFVSVLVSVISVSSASSGVCSDVTTEYTEDTELTENDTYYVPTIVIPFLSARASIWSRSNIKVLPAVTDRQVAPAAIIVSIVGTPTTGTSKRIS